MSKTPAQCFYLNFFDKRQGLVILSCMEIVLKIVSLITISLSALLYAERPSLELLQHLKNETNQPQYEDPTYFFPLSLDSNGNVVLLLTHEYCNNQSTWTVPTYVGSVEQAYGQFMDETTGSLRPLNGSAQYMPIKMANNSYRLRVPFIPGSAITQRSRIRNNTGRDWTWVLAEDLLSMINTVRANQWPQVKSISNATLKLHPSLIQLLRNETVSYRLAQATRTIYKGDILHGCAASLIKSSLLPSWQKIKLP